MIDTALLYVTLFMTGLMAGIFVCSAMIEHAARILDGVSWTVYKQSKERVFGPVMPVAFGLTVLLNFVSAIVEPMHLWFGLSAVLLVIVLAMTVVIFVPMNRSIQTWSGPTPDWSIVRTRWRTWNIARTVLTIAAYALVLIGFLR